MNIYDLISKMTLEHKTIFDMPLRVTFYARVSTQKEVQLNSQENQIQTFTELINNNINWTLVDGYIDTIRGEAAVNRNNFLKMISDAEQDKFDLIVCKEISRFSRDILDSISYTRKLFQNNVGVFFTSDNLCTIDRDSELRLGIMASIAQQEVARLSERVKFGHKKSIENGVVMGNSRIFGYIKKDKKLIIDPNEAEMVKQIYDLFATDEYSLRQIEQFLYEKGYTNHNGNPIYHTTIKAILSNPKYKGYYCGNKVKILDYRTKKQKFLPEEEWIMYKDETGQKVPAIVSEELWDKCNQILSRRCNNALSRNTGESVRGKRQTSPLSGKIVCTDCNCHYHHNSYGHGGKEVKWHWICANKKIKSNKCNSFAIKENEMVEILKSYFDFLMGLSNNIFDDYIKKLQFTINNSKFNNNQSDILQKEIDKLNLRKSKMRDLFADDLISKDEFKIEKESIDNEIAKLNDKIKSYQNSDTKYDDLIKKITSIRKTFSQYDFKSNNISKDTLYKYGNILIDKILVTPISGYSMQVTIVPQFGNSKNITISREEKMYNINNFSNVTNGHISKKMIDAYKQGIKS